MQRGDKTPFSSHCRNNILKRKFQKKSVVKVVILCYNYYIDVTIFREGISFKQKTPSPLNSPVTISMEKSVE
jgi:hypothetical protein